jgi:cobalt-zinc-cadmium efflux system membrane fusion protein
VAELEIELARARTAVSIIGRGRGGDVVIRAPIAGTVIDRRAAIGMAVEPGAGPLVAIGDPSGIVVTVEVFDRDVQMVRLGADVEVALVGLETPLRGHVAHIAPVVSGGLRTVPVRVELDAIPPGLRAGLYGRASISLGDEGLVLPSTAVLVRDGQTTVVYVEEGEGRFVRREVAVGPSIEGRVHVIGGLREGERVAVEGALLIDGAADQLL